MSIEGYLNENEILPNELSQILNHPWVQVSTDNLNNIIELALKVESIGFDCRRLGFIPEHDYELTPLDDGANDLLEMPVGVYSFPNHPISVGNTYVFCPPSRGKSMPVPTSNKGRFMDIIGNGMATRFSHTEFFWHTGTNLPFGTIAYLDEHIAETFVERYIGALKEGDFERRVRAHGIFPKEKFAQQLIASVIPNRIACLTADGGRNSSLVNRNNGKPYVPISNSGRNLGWFRIEDKPDPHSAGLLYYDLNTLRFLIRENDSPINIADIAYPFVQAVARYGVEKGLKIDPSNIHSLGRYLSLAGIMMEEGGESEQEVIRSIERIKMLFIPYLNELEYGSEQFEIFTNRLIGTFGTIIASQYLYMNPHSQNISPSGRLTEADLTKLSFDDYSWDDSTRQDKFYHAVGELYSALLFLAIIFNKSLPLIQDVYRDCIVNSMDAGLREHYGLTDVLDIDHKYGLGIAFGRYGSISQSLEFAKRMGVRFL